MLENLLKDYKIGFFLHSFTNLDVCNLRILSPWKVMDTIFVSLESECVTEFCAAIVSLTFLAPHPPSPVSFPPLPLRLCRSPAARPRVLPPFQLLHRSNGIQSALCLLWVVQPMARDGHQT